MEGYMWKEWRE